MEEILNGIRYLRPKSLTWWSGVGLILMGIFADPMSADLIAMGLGLIGARDAIWRLQE